MERGLNRMPVGFVTMRNRASASRPAMCSAKQEPRARMRFPYPIFTPRGAMSISVRNFIGQKYKFYIFAV